MTQRYEVKYNSLQQRLEKIVDFNDSLNVLLQGVKSEVSLGKIFSLQAKLYGQLSDTLDNVDALLHQCSHEIMLMVELDKEWQQHTAQIEMATSMYETYLKEESKYEIQKKAKKFKKLTALRENIICVTTLHKKRVPLQQIANLFSEYYKDELEEDQLTVYAPNEIKKVIDESKSV